MRWMQLGLCLAIAVGPFGVASAQEAPDAMEARLRDALRGATVQVRSLEDQLAQLQAQQAEASKQNELLQGQVDSLTKQLAAAPSGDSAVPQKANAERATAAYEQAVADFNRKLSDQNNTIGQLSETVDKWKAAYEEAVSVARNKEGERAQLAARVQGVSKQATDCEAKNTALVKVADEILDRYEHISVGEVLAAREPFVGTKRVELENIAQDYHDKILDQKASP